MAKNRPSVSVIMPVFNSEKYVAEAITSILTQTFIDFEFIIVDDGSTDATYEIIHSFNDKRLRVFREKINSGNNVARNKALAISVGDYICMMDSDDFAVVDRIQKQFEFMEANKQFGICGGLIQIMDSTEIIKFPEDYDEIKVWSLSNIMFRHPTVFMRSSFLRKYDLKYDIAFRYAADYDILVKAAILFPVTNIQEVLLKYRRHPDQISSAHAIGQSAVVNQVRLRQLVNFGIKASDEECKLHLNLMGRNFIRNLQEFEHLQRWANYLVEKNNYSKCYHSDHLSFFLRSLLKYILNVYKINQDGRNKKY